MDLVKLAVAPETVASVSAILSEHFQVQDPLEGIYAVSGGGVNDPNHRVAITQTGRRFGIKTQTRGGGPEGEKREEGFSKACSSLASAHACPAVRVEKIQHLQGFDDSASVITEWAPESKSVDKVTQEDTEAIRNLPDVLSQSGKWLAANLHLGLGDRGGLKNWVWSGVHERLTAVDAESAFQRATVQEHHPVIEKFYGRAKLKQERGVSDAAKAFEAGLRQAHEHFLAHPEAITQAVADIASAKSYTSPVGHLTSDQVVEKVFSEL
jgi:hypothetical protein